jgi:hypothetical protein
MLRQVQTSCAQKRHNSADVSGRAVAGPGLSVIESNLGRHVTIGELDGEQK